MVTPDAYPFLDVQTIGYLEAFGSTLVVLAVALVLAVVYRRLDRLRVMGDSPRV